MHCAPAGHAPRSVSAAYDLPVPLLLRQPRWVRSRESHIDLADGWRRVRPISTCIPRSSALLRDTHSFCDDLAGGENSLWGGSFHLRSSQHLPRCRWGGAVAVLADGLDGRLRRVIPYLLFPSDPASAAMHCAPAGHAPRSVSAPMNLALPLLLRHPRRVRSRGSHIDLADGLETGSPYFHLYSPGLALSRGGSLSCSSSPLSESALICSSFSPRRFICFVPSGSQRAHYGDSRFIYALQTVFTCLGVWLHLILNN